MLPDRETLRGVGVDDNELVLTQYRLEALRASGCIIERGRVTRLPNNSWSLLLVVQQPDGRAELRPTSMISHKKRREFASLSAVLEHAKRLGLRTFTIEPPAHDVVRAGWL